MKLEQLERWSGKLVGWGTEWLIAADDRIATLASIGPGVGERREVEANAYEHCVRSGEAAIGREHVSTLREGGEAPWGPLDTLRPRS